MRLKVKGNLQSLVFLFHKSAQIHTTRKNFGEAIHCYQELLVAAATGVISQQNIASAYGLLGDAYFESGDTSKAMESYEHCLRILEKLDEPAATAGAFLGLAIIYDKLAMPQQELEAYENAIKHIEKVDSSNDLGQYQYWLADSYMKVDQYEQALVYYRRSLDTFERQKNYEDAIRVHGKIAAAYSKLGSEEKIKEHLNIAVSLLEFIAEPEKKEESIAYLRSLFTPNA
jgi:tetratricopeptide (TPR) repeat protein